jgi:hypothetical protein
MNIWEKAEVAIGKEHIDFINNNRMSDSCLIICSNEVVLTILDNYNSLKIRMENYSFHDYVFGITKMRKVKPLILKYDYHRISQNNRNTIILQSLIHIDLFKLGKQRVKKTSGYNSGLCH